MQYNYSEIDNFLFICLIREFYFVFEFLLLVDKLTESQVF